MNPEIQFTRYLYEKDEVKLALVLCILNNKEESVFWAYELYYSGFKLELVQLFWSIYYDFYYTLNPSFEKYLLKKFKNNLVFETNCENHLAMIVNNFMIRPHTMDIFMLKQVVNMYDFETKDIKLESILENQDFMMLAWLILSEIKDEHIDETINMAMTYFINSGLKLDSKKIINEYKKIIDNHYQSNNKRVVLLSKILHYFVLIKNIKLGKNIYVHIEPEDVIIYENINTDFKKDDKSGMYILPAYKILPLATIYFIDSYNYLSLFGLKREKVDIKTAYYYQWVYHSSFSPLWKERIIKHNGHIDEINKNVVFDGDDDEESFYNEYGYEPDEQKREIQNKTLQEIKKERTWLSFYNEHKNNGIIDFDDDILNDIDKLIYKF
jgi:hypothetical protein